METQELKVIGHERCMNLRWQGYYIHAEKDPTVAYSDSHYWCQQTYIAIGPDGKAVEGKECSPARGCYQAL